MPSVRLLVVLVSATAGLAAQVPVTQEPRHRVMFEGGGIRILNVNVPPGDTTLEHRHEHDIVTVSMTGGADTREQAPGQPWGPVRPRRLLGDVRVTQYAGQPGVHRVENVGTSNYQLFAVENLRAGAWSASRAAAGPGTTLVVQGRAFSVHDVRLDRETSQTAHTHALPTIAVLLTGAVLSDGPDAQAKAWAPAPVGLKQLTERGEWLLVPAGDTHHLVRLGTVEARVIEIEVR